MKIRIYQINSDRDTKRLMFASYNEAITYGNIDGFIYDMVYEGDVEFKTLEDIFEMFNLNRPEDFKGHSLSVSDIVEVLEPSTKVACGRYYCDAIGWKKWKTRG